VKKSDSVGDFGRGFESAFADESDQLVNPKFGARKISPEAAAILANEKWRQKKSRHVSFYGSVSDTGA
jgi:hypothetical protein